MLIVMETGATPDEIKAVEKVITANGYEARPIAGGERMSIGVLRNKGPVDAALFVGMPGVKDVITGGDTPQIKYGNWRLMPKSVTMTENLTRRPEHCEKKWRAKL